jgi:hypothetical protein
MKLDIQKTLVVSTAHITEQDNELLENEAIVCYSNEYFYLIPLNQSSTDSVPGDNFSPAFKKLFEFAKNHEEGFSYLKLDRDGDILEGFDTFDW